MTDSELKLECFTISGGNLALAKEAFEWVRSAEDKDAYKDKVTVSRLELLNNAPESLVHLVRSRFTELDAAPVPDSPVKAAPPVEAEIPVSDVKASGGEVA